MRIVWMFLFSIWIAACGQQTQEIPTYYQEIVEHNGVGDIFDPSEFTFVRENGVSGFTEYIRTDPDRYFQEVLILVHDDTNMNAVFIHKEPIDSTVANIEDLEANFEDFQTRVTKNFGALRSLRPDDWRNAWIHEIPNEDERGLAAISTQLDQGDEYYLFVIIYMSKRFFEDFKEIFQEI